MTYLSILNTFRVIRCLSRCVSPKIAIFTTFCLEIFLLMRYINLRLLTYLLTSPGDAPGAITLNVVWMERELDAYKLSRCMCPSNYNRDRTRYWSKIVIFFIPPLHSTPQLGGVPVGITQPRWMAWLPDGKNISKISLFVLAQLTNVTDGQTDRQTDGQTPGDGIYRAYA